MSPDEEEARERLLFHLENQTGFWFGLVVGDDPRPRARIRQAAEAWCKQHGRAFVLHEPEPEGLVKLAVELARGDSPGVHWILADGVKGVVEAWNAGATQMLMAMNERREAYRKRLDGGIVVEGRSTLKRILREMAPDMFSIRAFIAEPGEDPKARANEFPEWKHPASLASLVSADEMDPDLALERLSRLIALEGPSTTKGFIAAEAQAMMSLFNTGRPDEAERYARDLLSRLERNADDGGDKHEYPRALAYDLLARIAVIKGDGVREAVHLWEQAFAHLSSHPVPEPIDAFFFLLLAIRISKGQAIIQGEAGDLDAARRNLERHLLALSKISATDLPPEMQIDLLDTYFRLANIGFAQDDLDPAEDVLSKAVALAKECESLHSDDPRWQFESLRSIAALGRVHLLKEDMASAVDTLVPAAELAEKLESHGSTGPLWTEVLEEFYRDLAFVLSCEVEYSMHLDLLRQRALSSMKRQFERTPDDVNLGWMLIQFHLDRAKLLEKEDVAGAKDSAQQALELASQLPVRSDEDAELKGQVEALRAFVRKPGKKRRPKKH